MVTLNNVKISGAVDLAPGATFGTVNSPSPGAFVTDPYTTQTPNNMVFYYWPTSYSVAKTATLRDHEILAGLVDMTGFVSYYGNNTEFTPITITPTLGPPSFWQPLSAVIPGMCTAR